jgi:hypothetical protein
MDLINESERRFTKKLCDTMTPVMIQQFWEIWLEAQKEAKGKNTVQVFQQLLRDVKTWNSSISHRNTEAIVKSNSMFPKLLAAVFVIHVKILSAIRTDKKSKKISIKLPANDVFVQECYINCAKDLYEDPDIIVNKNHSDEHRKRELAKRFAEHIKETIEYLVPMAEILDTYLTLPEENQGMAFDEEDEVEEVPDAPQEEFDTPEVTDPAVEGLPQNTPNMEFGKTPGGSDTVTVNNSLTPPSVPGGTPAPPPSNDNLFDDAPDAVKKIP